MKMKEANKTKYVMDTLVVPASLEYEAAILVDASPSRRAMKTHIEKIETDLFKVKSRMIYRIFNFFNLI